MNRRQAIYSFLLLGGSIGLGFTFGVFKWYKTPDFEYLDANKILVADIAEVLIPRTDTPGAKDINAEIMILKLLKEHSNRITQNNFIEGLKEVNIRSIKKYNKLFIELEADQKFEVIKYMQNEDEIFHGLTAKVKNKMLGRSFFTIIKELTSISYCTSMVGATQTLSYIAIPGSYNGCAALIPGQRSWATK